MDDVAGPSHQPNGASEASIRPTSNSGVSTAWQQILDQLEVSPAPPTGRPADAENGATEQKAEVFDIEQQLNAEQRISLGLVMDMFPDACPKWIAQRLSETAPDQLVNLMVNVPDHYDRKTSAKQDQEPRANPDHAGQLNVQDLMNMLDKTMFNPEQFLKGTPDPEATFMKINVQVKPLQYVDASLVAMQYRFQNILASYIKKTLSKHNYHFFPAFKELQHLISTTPVEERNVKPFMKRERKETIPWPANIDEHFCRECQFALFEDAINEYRLGLQQAHRNKLKEARRRGELCECACCLAECFQSDLLSCPEDHPFCRECIRKSLEPKINQGTIQLPCLSGYCHKFYDTLPLEQILDPVVYSRLLRNMQQQELRDARIENLRDCPFCHFAIIVDNPDEKLFQCLNPDCLKISCLECKKPNHIPLKCGEAEKRDQDETLLRTQVEEKVAQALIKHCPKCYRPVVKTIGCDHMVCVCRASFCYICGETYLNSKSPSGMQCHKCPPDTVNDPLKAGIQAKQEFLEKHPDLWEMAERAVDPNKLVDDKQTVMQRYRLEWNARPVKPTHNKYAQNLVVQRAMDEQRRRQHRWKLRQLKGGRGQMKQAKAKRPASTKMTHASTSRFQQQHSSEISASYTSSDEE